MFDHLRREGVGEVVGDLHELLLGGVGKIISAVDDLLQDATVGGLDVGAEGLLKGHAVLDVDAVEEALDSGEKSDNDILGLGGVLC